jgi:2,4-dienoyl-CoA reductase-like NADH-dependent reductase (Old Yellow Enzyme family)
MHAKYPKVFSPIKIGPVEVRNRTYSSPHSMPWALGTKPSDDYVHYVATRARGGLGLIMLSLTVPERSRGAQPCPSPKENIAAFRAIAAAAHAAGSKIFGEIFYQWIGAGSWQPLSPPAPMLTPSVSQFNFMDRRSASREMSLREIKEMLAAFGEATENLRAAGFDGIMLHVSHGALTEQFLSPYFNRRTDEYGGDLTNRMRFLMQQLTVVRQAAGGTMAVGMRLNCDELLETGYHATDAYEVLKRTADAGLLDFVDLDVAVEPDQFYMGMPPVFVDPHVYKPYVEAVRAAAGKVPVMSVMGRMTSVADAEGFLASGLCDMVGAARAFIAEPNLIKNAYDGKEEESRTCIACNACMSGFMEGMQICAINPGTYRERYWGPDSFSRSQHPSRVVVVGAGPAGLEAARVAALRGHDVVVFEARATLGGALALWAKLPGRHFYRKAVDWWERELLRLGIKVHQGLHVTASRVLEERPAAVILATGAVYSLEGRSNFRDLEIPGHDKAFVHRPEEILMGSALPTGRVIILDGEGTHTGVGIAEAIARAGGDVELVNPHLSPMSMRLTDTQDAHFIIKRIVAANVQLSPMTYIKRIDDHSVTLYNVHSEKERTVNQVDAVILATGRVPVNALERELDGKVSQLFSVGDALAPRVWSSASFEGQKFARLIGETDAPSRMADVYFGHDDGLFNPFPADLQRPGNG